MTITDNGRVELDEELIARGRELTAGGRVPSKRELQRHLRTSWDRVNAVLLRLTDEAEREAAMRRRKALRDVAHRRRQRRSVARRRVVNVCFRGVKAAGQQLASPAVAERRRTDAAAAALTVRKRRVATWPVVLLGFGATVAIWSGWVDMGRLTGFGLVHPFPGIPGLDEVQINAAITLPFGMETYGAYALYVWLSAQVPVAARTFARRSAIGALVLGALGQVAYHLMIASGMTRAPWWITTLVACLPVAVLGMGAALRHLVHAEDIEEGAK